MGRISKLACVGVLAALPTTFGVAATAPEAEAVNVVFNAFDPTITITECPETVQRGERFVIRGTALPTPGAVQSHVYVSVAFARADGSPARRRSTAIFECIDDGEETPFEIIGRASGWSGGTIHVGATIVSHDAPVPPELADEQLVSIDECEIQVVRRTRGRR